MNRHVAGGYVLSVDLERPLARVAERSKEPPARLLETALSYFLDQIETDEEIRTYLDERLLEMKQTGLHVTNEEVMEWLDRRAKGRGHSASQGP